MQPLQTFSLATLYVIRNSYLEQTAKSDEHQNFLDHRIMVYTREIYQRESDIAAAMQLDFTNLLNELNHGHYMHIRTQ